MHLFLPFFSGVMTMVESNGWRTIDSASRCACLRCQAMEIGVGVKYYAVGDTAGLDSYFPSANIYPQELLEEEGEPQGITMDRCPDQDRPPVV